MDAQPGQGVAGGRHVVLVADQAAEPAVRCVVDVEVGAVAVAPDQPLGEGGHELAVRAEQLAAGPNVGERVVERAAARFALVEADHDGRLRLAGRVRNAIPLRAADHHAVLEMVLVERGEGGAVGGSRVKVGVVGDPGFGEDDQGCAGR